MPYKSKDSKSNDGENHGAPGGEGQPKGAGNKPANADAQDRYDEFEQDGADQATTPELLHPNRNPDKPQLDKPPYGGGH